MLYIIYLCVIVIIIFTHLLLKCTTLLHLNISLAFLHTHLGVQQT